jgi:hypothetical protein
MDIAVNAIVGALILLALGWLKADINRLSDRVEKLDERLTNAVNVLSERVARIEGRLDEREARS